VLLILRITPEFIAHLGLARSPLLGLDAPFLARTLRQSGRPAFRYFFQ